MVQSGPPRLRRHGQDFQRSGIGDNGRCSPRISRERVGDGRLDRNPLLAVFSRRPWRGGRNSIGDGLQPGPIGVRADQLQCAAKAAEIGG